MIGMNENGLFTDVDPMVQVPLSVYEEGVKAISDLMHITALLSKADRMPESLLTELINATLGLTEGDSVSGRLADGNSVTVFTEQIKKDGQKI